jgi:hypothetical protein
MSLVLSGTVGVSDVDGSAATPAIRGTDTNTGIFFPAADTIAFAEGGVESARFDPNGNLGLKVTPSASWQAGRAVMQIGPAMAFDCNSPTQALVSANRVFTGSQDLYLNSGNATAYQQLNGAHAWFNAPSGTAGNAISFTQAMTLDASSNLLVGNTSKLGGGIGGIDINRSSGPGLTLGVSGTARGFFYVNTGNNGVLWETVSGVNAIVASGGTGGVSLANGATAWASLSDERHKDIIEPISNATDKVASLRSVIGKYKTDEAGTRRSFLIAQDVQAVLPEAVDNTDTENLALRYSDLTPLLVAAIQEQQAIITALTARVTALEGAQP